MKVFLMSLCMILPYILMRDVKLRLHDFESPTIKTYNIWRLNVKIIKIPNEKIIACINNSIRIIK